MNGTQLRTLVLVCLFGVMFMLHSEAAQAAEITIVDSGVIVETDAYEVRFENGVINQIANKITDEVYTLPLGIDGAPVGIGEWSGLLNRERGNISTNEIKLTAARKINPLKAEILFGHGPNNLRFTVAVDPTNDDLLIEQDGLSDTAGVHGIRWGCGNLDVRNLELILPVYGGQIIDASSPITYATHQYPGSGWEAQLAIIQGEHGGFFVRSMDETFQFKHLNYRRDRDSFALGFETHNQAPFDSLTAARSATWRMNTYTGDWRVPARDYRNWMEQTFKPRRLSEMPAWVQDIGLVVTSFGIGDTDLLDKLAEQIDSTKTLLMLNGVFKGGEWWTGGEYYPDYKVRTGFGRFMEVAHRHGFRVMPYVNLLGFSPHHPLYADFQKFQFRDPWNKNLIGWVWDTASTHRHAFINPASSGYRKIFVEQLKEVWQKYRVDAFFLDVSHLVVNDANGLIEGLNAAQGNVLLHKELAEAMPGVAFGGERLHEVTFFRESFAGRPKLPSKAKPHPISAFLFSPYTYPFALSLPNPDESPSLYYQHLDSYESWGVLPTLPFWSVEQLAPDRLETQKLLSIARTWQHFGLKPDFDADWAPDTLFQYMGLGGEIATHQRTAAGSTLILPQDSTGYERVFGVTEVQTDWSVPHWHAYNETAILGLNPKKSYFLGDTPRDFSKAHINALPNGVIVKEARVTENAALFQLDRADSSYEIDLLSILHLARTGIVLNGEELPRQKGATFHRTGTFISGIRKEAIDAHPPWQDGISGDAFGEWTLALPDSPSISLDFYIGLAEGAIHSNGVTFVVSLQGDEIFRRHHNEQKWQLISLDLTAYRGQQVTLRLTTNPGPNGDTGMDWARWGEPKIVSEPMKERIGFFLPNEPIKLLPDTIWNIGQGQYVLDTELPAKILFLIEPAQHVVPPYNLGEAPFVAGLQFEGIFKFGSAWGSGTRGWGTSGGVQKVSIQAHPPDGGQTVLQFLLPLPHAQEITFSFSMGLNDAGCSLGVLFQVMLNGQVQFEHSTRVGGWVDAHLSLSKFVGETVLLELVTDPDGTSGCDAAYWADLLITAEGVESQPSEDVNRDGMVNILDLVLVAQEFGSKPPRNTQADVNNDGQVNILDLVQVARALGENAAAPSAFDIFESQVPEEMIALSQALDALEGMSEKSPDVEIAIRLLRHWLTNLSQTVAETKLLPNFPNPFNPETWIPYQLAEEAEVTVFIHDTGGRLVRTIPLGFKAAGYYLTRSEAVHWDGQNENGEQVSSGVYFVRFVAGEFSASRRVVIVK